MELKLLRIQSCYNLGKALALALLCMSGSANNYATLLLLTHSFPLKMVITHCYSSEQFSMPRYPFCMQFNSFVPSFFVPTGKPQGVMEESVMEILIMCRLWKARKTFLSFSLSLSICLSFPPRLGDLTQRSHIRICPFLSSSWAA